MWETITKPSSPRTPKVKRLSVPGGWLYIVQNNTLDETSFHPPIFVPEPAVTGTSQQATDNIPEGDRWWRR